MSVLLLTESEVESLVSIEGAIDAVEAAFEEKGAGKAQMPPKSYIYFDQFNGDFRDMPAYLEETGAAGIKVVNVHPDNPKGGELPAVMATIVLLDPETGKPLAIMGGTRITDMRTGAAGAVAAKYLARENSSAAAMVGTGAQAVTQLSGLNQIFDLEKVWAYSRIAKKREKYTELMSERLEIEVDVVDAAEKALREADIVVTTTPSRTPVVSSDWISKGTHINAIGADAEGKQELDPAILGRGKVVVDEWKQASHSGEINVPISEGEFSQEDVHADIGEVVIGEKSGRTSDNEVTVFDSTGLAVQDVGTAWRVYEKAREEGAGEEIELL